MEWIQVLSIIVTMLGGIFYIHSEVREIRKDMQQHTARTDKLYEMYCEMQKEIKQLHIDFLKKNTP